ncbi:MAG: Type IV pilus assembly protein PilM [Parcubacteria group bacterium GW2011_GWA2_47_16]|nr:MAG: Type IV pilus assembly protein PilM [Parcubacteria group bacterium GW2011_GWA2_47_16]
MENPFKAIADLFKKSGDSILGIDIGSSSIKIIQLRKKAGQAILETYGELALGPYSGLEIGRATHLPAEKLSEALNDVLRESNTTTKKCGIAIPLPSSMVSLIEMPAVPPSQLATMIPLEARKYIPVPITEITLDWWVIPQDDSKVGAIGANQSFGPGGAVAETSSMMPIASKVDVLVVAIHNEAINKYQEIVRKTALDSSFFEIEIFSTMRAVLAEENATVMIFDLGAASTKLYIVDRGIIRVSHTINRGSQDITLAMSRSLNVPIAEAENIKRSFGLEYKHQSVDVSQVMSATLNFIFSEANRVLLNFERRYNKPISNVILTGGGINLKGFSKMAETGFQAPIVIADPFSKLQAPAFLDPVLKGAGPEFAVAIGIALRKLQELE